jgi:hypothetical protein
LGLAGAANKWSDIDCRLPWDIDHNGSSSKGFSQVETITSEAVPPVVSVKFREAGAAAGFLSVPDAFSADEKVSVTLFKVPSNESNWLNTTELVVGALGAMSCDWIMSAADAGLDAKAEKTATAKTYFFIVGPQWSNGEIR